MTKRTLAKIFATATLSMAMASQIKPPVHISESPKETPDNTPIKTQKGVAPADTFTATRRTPQKIYHRFEEIPEISDMEATLYNKNEYTYVADLDLYQKSGKLKIKRVLKDEVTQINLISTMYRGECGDYKPKKNEDPLLKYNKSEWNFSKTGIYVGSTQMDDNCVLSFIKYLAATPKNRKYVLPLLKCSNNSVEDALHDLQKRFFDENGQNRPLKQRNAALSCKAYTGLSLKENAWSQLCSQKFKQKLQETLASRKISISNLKKTYLYLAETIPNFDKEVENFQLSFYPLGRICKPNQVIEALAENLNLRDSQNQIDATRVPIYAISASISNLNWKGNGKDALRSAQQPFSKNWQPELLQATKSWVNGKARDFGIDEISKLNILTPYIIKQYQLMEIPGASGLLKEYTKQVNLAEKSIEICAKKRNYQSAYSSKKRQQSTISFIKAAKDNLPIHA